MLVLIRGGALVVAGVHALFQPSVLDVELLGADKVEELAVLPLDAAEGVLGALRGLNVKVKGTRGGGFPGRS